MESEGFPYFWLGAEAESIPTPWRTVWLAPPQPIETTPKLSELAAELVECGYRIVAVDESTKSVLADIASTRRGFFLECEHAE